MEKESSGRASRRLSSFDNGCSEANRPAANFLENVLEPIRTNCVLNSPSTNERDKVLFTTVMPAISKMKVIVCLTNLRDSV